VIIVMTAPAKNVPKSLSQMAAPFALAVQRYNKELNPAIFPPK
jgi:hypothetical protein